MKKRIYAEVTAAQHATITEKARALNLSVSNFIRKRLGLPLEKHGERKDLKKEK